VLRRDFPISSSVAGWEANNILTFLSFHVLTQQSHSFTMARRKLGVLNNLGKYASVNTAKTNAEKIRQSLKSAITRAKGKENRDKALQVCYTFYKYDSYT
jgi:hypothetical protein